LIGAIYEPLVSRTGATGIEPCLATTWHVDANALIWDIRLREHVVFHDGSDLTASDVAANLERIRDPKVGGAFGTQGVYASYIGGARFEVVNKGRLRIHLRESMADLLELLVEMPIAPEDALDDLPKEHVGSGPYRLRDLDKDAIEMEAHSKHWRGKPANRRLVWKAEPDEEARVNAVASGNADVASGVTLQGIRLASAKGVRVSRMYGSLCVIYMINCIIGTCKDRRVRQALNCALDRKAIIDRITGGAAEPLTGPLTPLHFGWDPETSEYPHDPATARRLLAEAGYPDGLTLKMDIPSEMPDEAIPLSKMMAEQYREVGVEIELKVHRDRPAYADMVRAKQIGDLCCFDSSPLSTFRVFREKIHSGIQGPWWEGYTNLEVDALIEKAQRTVDQPERQRIYRTAYRMIRDDAPWVFLYRPESFWVVGRGTVWEPSWDGVVRIQ
jgi:peptide/nickel transport system substrate-binding protein